VTNNFFREQQERWHGRKAGRCVVMWAEAFFGLDLFSYFFVSRQKSTRQIVRDEFLD
jgi:hypothetical protein